MRWCARLCGVFFVALLVLGVAAVGPSPAAAALQQGRPALLAVEQGGERSEIFEVGKDVTVRAGTTVHRVVVIGGKLRVEGVVDREIVVIGGDVEISGVVRDIVIVLGGNVVVRGHVGHTVMVGGGDLSVAPAATIGRRGLASDSSVVLIGDAALTAAPGAQILGRVQHADRGDSLQAVSQALSHVFDSVTPGFAVLSWLFQLVVAILLAVVAAVLLPRQMRATQRQLVAKWRGSLFCGAGVFFLLIPLLLIIMVVSIVGLLVVVPYVIFLLLLSFFTTITVASFVARAVLEKLRLDRVGGERELIVSSAAGAVVTVFISHVPVLGAALLITMMVFGLGAAILAVVQWQRERRALPWED